MKNDGGSAFPYHIDESAIHVTDFPGMTLRDWFAGQALAGMIGTERWEQIDIKHIAVGAFDVANAMLAAREGKDG